MFVDGCKQPLKFLSVAAPRGEEHIVLCHEPETVGSGVRLLLCRKRQSCNGKKEYEGKPISKQLEDAISERKNFLASRNDAEFVKVTLDDAGEFGQQALSTIICEGDAIGAVILYEKDEKSRMTETESKLAIAAAGFLGKQMEQ